MYLKKTTILYTFAPTPFLCANSFLGRKQNLMFKQPIPKYVLLFLFYIFHYTVYTHYKLRFIRYSFTCSLIFKCTGDHCTCSCIHKSIHRQPTSFWNVYYNTTTKQHNAAHYRHRPGEKHIVRCLDNPRLPVHACTLTHILQRGDFIGSYI